MKGTIMSYVYGQAATTAGPGGGSTAAPTTAPPLGTTAAPTTAPPLGTTAAPTTTPMVTTTPPMVTTLPPGVITTPPPPYGYVTNSPPCKGTCTCTWTGSEWNCDPKCGDCLCVAPSTVDDSLGEDGRPNVEIIPVKGNFVGEKMPGMCVPEAGGLKTQAGLSSAQIANGRGYEGMPMGLDTSLDQNGNSHQITSYISIVNGQKQVKVAAFNKDNQFMDLNIDGLESINGVVKSGP